MFILRNLFEKYRDERKQLYISFIDFRKAFDSVWHTGLFIKLLKRGISGPYYKVLKSMYMKSSASVKVDGGLSQPFMVKRGVRQGDILSPLLFNIYINDIIEEFQQEECDPPIIMNDKVGCLLYADDLMVLSTTPNGLQTGLDKLSEYCKKWKLEINVSKSKTMCFPESKRVDPPCFTANGTQLEMVKQYCYLGIEITSSGSFKTAEQSMSYKAEKALFKLKSLLWGSRITPVVGLRLFDQLIKPIATYGCEIWGIDAIKRNQNDILKIAKNLESYNCEKLNVSFSRFLLGVHRKSQLTAVRGELGRFPIGIDIIANTILYHKHLSEGTISPLLKKAFMESQARRGSVSWVDKVTRLKQHLSLDTISIHRPYINSLLQKAYTEMWKTKLETEAKMRTYRLFKKNFAPESYLRDLPRTLRAPLTRFRISAHNLAIERGRYTKVPLEQRTCPVCPTKVEDELHALLECRNHVQERTKTLSMVEELCPEFTNLNTSDKFIFLLSMGGKISELTGKLVAKVLKPGE